MQPYFLKIGEGGWGLGGETQRKGFGDVLWRGETPRRVARNRATPSRRRGVSEANGEVERSETPENDKIVTKFCWGKKPP